MKLIPINIENIIKTYTLTGIIIKKKSKIYFFIREKKKKKKRVTCGSE